ncbi:MAG: 16S rRNA (uracil(1498)-N(3))-methyltransferase [Chloroflexi bacterium]|nr:16S rRNA (uracil(1498)-N(3))-methyltransferase [Chloroflexota bacterium]
MHHFFVYPEVFGPDAVTVTGACAHQITNVLRLIPGDRIVLLDNTGWEYETELRGTATSVVTGIVVGKRLARTEPHTKIVLYQGMLRTNHFEFVIQKGTELGVSAFVPVICERSVVGEMREVAATKWERWQRIITEAAEQSERAKLPLLLPATTFQRACDEAQGISLIASERKRAPGARSVLARLTAATEEGKAPPRPFAVNLFIGPEGGFSPSEVSRAQDYKIIPISMGPRILRAETAALALTTLALSAFGDMGC